MEQISQVFNFEGSQVRTMVDAEGNPLFNLKDLCEILDLHQVSRVKNRLEDGVTASKVIQDNLGRRQKATFVNEDGMYDVILDSRKPEARNFRKWVTNQVLPSIRKTGQYKVEQNTPSYQIDDPIERAEKWIEEAKYTKKLKQENENMKPKANFADEVLDSDSTLSVTQIAKDYGMSARKLNGILHELEVQYKQGDQWFLYAEYQNKGYTKSETYRAHGSNHINTKWTEKGRKFIYELLKDEMNMLPVNAEQSTELYAVK